MDEKQSYTPLSKDMLLKIKAGDVIERMLAFSIPMHLIVSEVTDEFIFCGSWTFDRNTGLEIDEDIPTTVSYIRNVYSTEEEKAKIKKK